MAPVHACSLPDHHLFLPLLVNVFHHFVHLLAVAVVVTVSNSTVSRITVHTFDVLLMAV